MRVGRRPPDQLGGALAGLRHEQHDRRRGPVVLERDARGALVAGAVAAGAADEGGRVVGARVRRAGAAVDSRHRVHAAEGDGQRVVVPAVRVGSPAGSRRPPAEPWRRNRARTSRPALVLPARSMQAPLNDAFAVVRARVDLRRSAGVDPRRCVRAVERDPERLVVPAVRVRLSCRNAELPAAPCRRS